MSQSDVHDQLVALHEAWSALPSTKRPKAFRIYVAKKDRQLFVRIYRDPSLMHTLSRRMQADWKGEVVQEIGPAIVKKYIGELMSRYFAGGHNAPSPEAFVNDFVAQCACEADLRDLLAKTS